jgi:DNA (cytosine-5)-methyltransferase 1
VIESTHFSRARGGKPIPKTSRRRPLVVLDAFCGAGGSSTGARAALDARAIRHKLIAINHWDVAIETHEKNHPDAQHVRANVYRQDPRELVPDGKVDLFIASPTCSTFSRAKGGRPISWDQRYGRMTPTQVVRWCSLLDVTCLLIENVPEFVEWGPCRRINPGEEPAKWKPIPEKKGKLFRAWLRRLQRLGFRKIEWRILNAADFGDATTRRRFFLLARRDGKPLRWPAPTHAKDGASREPLFALPPKPWKAAREIIDWSIRGKSLLRRKRQLKKKTLERIKAGAERFAWPAAFVEVLRRLIACEPVDASPLPALPNGVVPRPLLVVLRRNADVKSVDDPTPALCAGGNHVGLVEPLVLGQHGGATARPASEPVPTIATEGAIALIAPYYSESKPVSVDEPLGTITTRDRFALVAPVTHADASRRARSVEDPLPTVTGARRGELAVIVGAFGERPGQAPRVHSIDQPAPTVCARGRVQLAEGVLEGEVFIDILFRMLEPHELAAAMGFPPDYRWPETKTDATKLVGNAVATGVARALTDALVGATS